MKQIFNITSGNTDASEQILSIRLGNEHFGFAISNLSNELLKLSWYNSDTAFDLQDVYGEHPELRNSFYKTIIGYDHPRSILLPTTWPAQNEPGQLLDIMYGSNGNNVVISENIPGWQLQNIYAIPADIGEWIARHFPSAVYSHAYSIVIKQIDSSTQGNLIINFNEHDFCIVAGKANKLLLAQTFSYASPADVIFYLLRISEEFSLSQESVVVSLSGLIEKESSLYREIAHYFLNVVFREPGWQLSDPNEQKYPSHFFTSLNDLAICAL